MVEFLSRRPRCLVVWLLAFAALSLVGRYVADTGCVSPDNVTLFRCSASQAGRSSGANPPVTSVLHAGSVLPGMPEISVLLTLAIGLVFVASIGLSWRFPPILSTLNS